MEKKVPHGRNVNRFREMLGLKQESLATELGDSWNQRKNIAAGTKADD